MSARDELARIVDEVRDDPARRDMSRIIEREHSMARFQGFGEWDQARLVAHNLHAAGYRKPRTITTVEELDALPVGSVVLHNGRAFQHYPAYPAPFDEYQQWKCGDGGFVRSTKDGSSILPATLIHEPAL